MMYPVVRGALAPVMAAALLSLTSPAAQAQAVRTPDLAADQRCIFLGPAVVSGWLNLLRSYAEDDFAEAADGTRLMTALVDLYQAIGCDARALNAALDCVTSAAFAGASEIAVHDTSPRCMREAGMPIR